MVIHQNVVVLDQIYKNHRGSNFAMQEDFSSIAKISLAYRKFSSLAKFYRDLCEIAKLGIFARHSKFR